MDWSAVAALVAECADLPVVLVSEGGELLLVAPAAERALGWAPGSAGSDLARYIPPHAAAGVRSLLDRARSGALRALEIEVLTPRGSARARFETRSIGSQGESALLLVLERLTPGAPADALDYDYDYDYEVRDIATGGFRLTRVWKPGLAVSVASGTCYEVFHGRAAPCEGCPAVSGAAAMGESAKAQARSPHDYLVTTATPLGQDVAHVSVRRLSMATLSAMLQARLDELAARARLSARERSIFGYLMDGRAVDEIATELDIKPRTVKFHQANVLQKLGADSRRDLMRLVL